jgi:hypothetical protein
MNASGYRVKEMLVIFNPLVDGIAQFVAQFVVYSPFQTNDIGIKRPGAPAGPQQPAAGGSCGDRRLSSGGRFKLLIRGHWTQAGNAAAGKQTYGRGRRARVRARPEGLGPGLGGGLLTRVLHRGRARRDVTRPIPQTVQWTEI